MAPGAEGLPRDLVVLELRGLPGPAGQDPPPHRGEGQGLVRAHAERLGPRRRPHARGDPRELPREGRQRPDPRGAAALHGWARQDRSPELAREVEMGARKVAVVTGANRGLGRETARQLAGKGYTVVLTSREREKAERAARELTRE